MAKILVIEDNDSVRENLLELLDAEGYEPLEAKDGVEGVRLARQENPDLIICDILMPHLDGYGVWASLAREPETAIIPFIYLTAKTERSDLRRGMELGADDYITKPFTRDELLNAIHTRLEKSATLRNYYQKKLSNLRSEISQGLPHELLTPLSVVLGFSELLVQNPNSLKKEQVLEIARNINRSAEKLLHSIQLYLLFADLEGITSDPDRLRLILDGSVSSAWLAITEIARVKAIEDGREADVRFEIADAQLQISEIYLQKMIEELLENAFQLSTPGTAIDLKGEVDQQMNLYQLSVTDRGRGLTDEQIKLVMITHLYDRIVFPGQTVNLGLAMVKRLVEIHGGTMNLKSEPGKMTTVNVTLPLYRGQQNRGHLELNE